MYEFLRRIGPIHSICRIHYRSALGQNKSSVRRNGSDGATHSNQSNNSNRSHRDNFNNSVWYFVGTITPNMKGVHCIERQLQSSTTTCDMVWTAYYTLLISSYHHFKYTIYILYMLSMVYDALMWGKPTIMTGYCHGLVIGYDVG